MSASLSVTVDKRARRRTKAEIEALRLAVLEVLADDNPQTCRSVFYRLVSHGVVPKTEHAYKNTVVRLLGLMRLEQEIPFGWITDGTRLRQKPRTHTSLGAALQRTRETYRRALWAELPVHVEVWSEKDAIAGVLVQETWAWDVPLLVCRGYPSLTYLMAAAREIESIAKPTFVYYFGDHDPSGVDISRNVRSRLEQFAPNAAIHFERVAVTPEQISRLGLPTRPTKQTDTRAKGFEGGSVEVDAIEPAELRRLARDCISQHIDPDVQERLAAVEAAERETLDSVLAYLTEAQP